MAEWGQHVHDYLFELNCRYGKEPRYKAVMKDLLRVETETGCVMLPSSLRKQLW